MNIGKADSPEDWRLREAATFAFGSILDGPPPDKLAALVAVGLPFLLNALKDPHTAVRHTTAWTIGALPRWSLAEYMQLANQLRGHGQVAEVTHAVSGRKKTHFEVCEYGEVAEVTNSCRASRARAQASLCI